MEKPVGRGAAVWSFAGSESNERPLKWNRGLGRMFCSDCSSLFYTTVVLRIVLSLTVRRPYNQHTLMQAVIMCFAGLLGIQMISQTLVCTSTGLLAVLDPDNFANPSEICYIKCSFHWLQRAIHPAEPMPSHDGNGMGPGSACLANFFLF